MSVPGVNLDDPTIQRDEIDGVQGPLYKVVDERFNTSPDFPLAEDAIKYAARPEDLFIVTYPKNGTTWTQQIVTCIQYDGQVPQGKKLYDFSPFLEMLGRESAENVPRPGSIKTHLPFHLQPKHEEAKYIIVFRNAKDACVSFHHHHQLFPGYGVQGMDFHDFFKFWLKGTLECSSYFDWVLSWWNQRNNPSVLILLYEDMKSDIRGAVLKIAEFMGQEYKRKLIADDELILKKVLENTTLQKMKKDMNEGKIAAFQDEIKPLNGQKLEFIRKGIVGDYMNYFNEQENEILEKMFHEKFDGTGLEHLWDKYKIFKQ